MFLLKRPNGIYHLIYTKPNGKRTSVSTKTKLKSEANKFLTKFAANQIDDGEHKILPITVESFSKEFLKHSETVHTYWTNYTYKQTFGFFNSYFPNSLISELQGNDISRYIESRIKSASIYQARKDLINIAAALNWAIDQGYLIENPCKNVAKVRVPQKLPLYYSPNDLNTLLSAIDSDDIKDIVLFAVNTGLRQMELLKLQWTQINFAEKMLILDNQHHITKGKKVRTIPLNLKAFSVLESRYKNHKSGNIFLYNKQNMNQDFLSHKFAVYIRKAKINSKLNFHSHRHTFASRLVQKGVSIYEVSKLLGHSDIKDNTDLCKFKK
jgi:integrase